jgi:hypothetical protein
MIVNKINEQNEKHTLLRSKAIHKWDIKTDPDYRIVL